MGSVEKSTTVAAPAQQLFDFLADIRNLPRYFSRMTEAEPAGDGLVRVEAVVPGGGHQEGEAWLETDVKTRTLSWGSKRKDDYHGKLLVEGGDESSTVTITLTTPGDVGDSGEDLETSLDTIRQLVEAGPAPSA